MDVLSWEGGWEGWWVDSASCKKRLQVVVVGWILSWVGLVYISSARRSGIASVPSISFRS